MSNINAFELIRCQQEKDAKKIEAYKKIYYSIEKKISISSSMNLYYTWFEVPEFILGFPLYNLSDCIDYIVQNLISNGFKAEHYNPNILLIKWIPDSM